MQQNLKKCMPFLLSSSRSFSLSASMALPSLPLIDEDFSVDRKGDEIYANINWDELGFGVIPTDYMYTMKCYNDDSFLHGNLTRYGNIELSPFSGILNYGQGLFEGLKAHRGKDGRIRLFRPEQNAIRMKIGAKRLCMPSPSVDQFVDAVKKTVCASKPWVPPPGKGSLYIRPLLMGNGPVLGVGPAPEYTFLVYTSPVGSYHKKGRMPLSLLVEEKLHRATPGGTGSIKTITNYSPIYKALTTAKAKGFSDVLFLDAVTGKNVEEVSACNIFIVKDNVISTPAASGTILPGITRKSIIEIALDFGYQVDERIIPLEELMEADEVFCTGTAVVLTPVGNITHQSKRVEYRTGENSVSEKLYRILTGIQSGQIKEKMGWMVEID